MHFEIDETNLFTTQDHLLYSAENTTKQYALSIFLKKSTHYYVQTAQTITHDKVNKSTTYPESRGLKFKPRMGQVFHFIMAYSLLCWDVTVSFSLKILTV